MSKRQTKYNPQWERDHFWIQKTKDDKFSAYCKICKKTFSVSGGGIALVKQHERTKVHESRIQESCNQRTFQKGSGDVLELDKTSIQFSDEEILTRAEIMQALKCVDANWSFQSANDEARRFAIMFPKSLVAKNFKLNETKMKYTIQFGIAPYFKERLKADLKDTAFTFKFDETTSQQVKKQYDGYTQYWSDEHQCIKVSYNGTLMVDHCPAEKLLEHFLEFIKKTDLDLRLMLHTGMDGPNVNLKFEELLKSSEAFEQLNTSILSIGTCPLHITHNGFKAGILKLDFSVDSLAIDINFFFKLSAARRADYIDIGSVTDTLSHFLQKHSSTRWVTLKKVCCRLLEQFENLKKYFIDFLPTTSTFKKTVKETARYKRIEESLSNKLTVPYLAFIAFIANDFERFLTMFQSMKPMIHILHSEMIKLVRNLMNKFVKSRLLVDVVDGKRVPKSTNDLLSVNVLDVKNCKPIKLIDIGTKAKSCFNESLEMTKEEKEFRQDCLGCYQVSNTVFSNQ